MCSSFAPQRVQTYASVSHALQCADGDHSHVAQIRIYSPAVDFAASLTCQTSNFAMGCWVARQQMVSSQGIHNQH